MKLDALRIEPVTPVRPRGTPTGAPTPSPEAPFSRVLSQVENKQSEPTTQPGDHAEPTQAAAPETAPNAPHSHSEDERSDAERPAPGTPRRVNAEDGSPGRRGQGQALGHTKTHPAHSAHSDAHGSSGATPTDTAATGSAETAGLPGTSDQAASSASAGAVDVIKAEALATDPQAALTPLDTPATQAPAQQNVSLEVALGQAQAEPDQAASEPVAADSEPDTLAGTLEQAPAHAPRTAAEPVEAKASANGTQTPVIKAGAHDADTAAATTSTPSIGSQPGSSALQDSLQRAGERSADTSAAPALTQPFGQTLRALIQGIESPAPAAAPPASYPITVPFGSPRFGAAFGERVSWMVREGLQNAELTLNPPDLGPIRIALSMEKDAASFGFNATHAQTRAAIEQALPRLRELLAEQGLSLGHTSIDAGTGGKNDQWSGAQAGAGRSPNGRGPNPATSQDEGSALQSAGRGPRARVAGRVDLFA